MDARINTLIPYENIEYEAINQLLILLNFDIVKKISVMPDIHAGYFMPIGTVALVEDHVSPAMVGYDIGCGMSFVETEIAAFDIIKSEEDKKFFHHQIKASKNAIPVGFSKRSTEHKNAPIFESASGDKELSKTVDELSKFQFGTLGGGNHFIEIGMNKKGNLCIVIHSGSRKCGYDIAAYYMEKAKQEGYKEKFLNINTDLGKAYLSDLKFFQEWALLNRLEMTKSVLNILGFSIVQINNIIKNTLINENHNHAVFCKDGIIHRKGATPAEKDQLGLIPGNMRDGTYITIGLGNEDYLCSSSHGAGRVLSRRKAKESFDKEDFEIMMYDSDVFAEPIIDECPEVYKDINEVIGFQEGIVINTIDKVTPLINIKG